MKIYNGYEPTPKQLAFHNSNAKFKGLITGVGFGKTAAGSNESLKTAVEYPNSMHLILAPTSKIMQNATLKEFFKWCPKEIIRLHLKSKQQIYLKGSTEPIIYLTADNERHIDRLRGMEIGSAWADEVRLMPSYIWDVLLTRLRSQNGPLKMFATTTSKGYNWLYYYFLKKQDPKTKERLENPEDYELFGGSTFDNPYTPQEWKDNLKAQLHGRYAKQELYGGFVAFEGQVYDNLDHNIHIVDHKKIKDKEFKEFIVGIDWGFSNPTAALIIGLDSDDRAYILEELYRKRMDTEQLGEWLMKKKEQYKNLNMFYADPSEPMNINKLQGMGINVVKASNQVMPGINFVYSMFEVQKDNKPRIFISNKCSNLIDEINIYRYADEKEGKEAKEAPIKENDHALDALRYALYSHLQTKGKFSIMPDVWS